MDNSRLFALPSQDDVELYEGDLPQILAPFQARATAEGADFDKVALDFLQTAGSSVLQVGGEIDGVPIDAIVRGRNGRTYLVAAHGTFADTPQAGLRRVDTVHKVGHRASMLPGGHEPLLVITSHLPRPGTKAAFYLARSRHHIFDIVATTGDLAGFHRLQTLLVDEPPPDGPLPATWRVEMSQPELPLETPTNPVEV
ncbi:MAG: hypothetical protein M3285_12070 [Actinomycetota bacterium]|nr:hypothetical protein [Actinomycetota bacterium]